jgi:hypothetical protein
LELILPIKNERHCCLAQAARHKAGAQLHNLLETEKVGTPILYSGSFDLGFKPSEGLPVYGGIIPKNLMVFNDRNQLGLDSICLAPCKSTLEATLAALKIGRVKRSRW